MTAYYNEFDPYAAQWLRNLISAGLIAPGEVDERSITDVRPSELAIFTQCHFFAGIGGWSRALRLAGWGDDRPVWTGSCPCQPFSAAGKQQGVDDARHLWPVWFDLIRERRPSVVFGEQVAAAVGHQWLDAVSRDMEGEGYAIGSAVLGAHSVGSPHIRQRLWFVADAPSGGCELGPRQFGVSAAEGCGDPVPQLGAKGIDGVLADASGVRWDQRFELESNGRTGASKQDGLGGFSGLLADADDTRSQGWGIGRHGSDQRAVGQVSLAGGVANANLSIAEQPAGQRARPGQEAPAGPHPKPYGRGELAKGQPHSGPLHGFWRDADWLFCRDGKWRPVRPGTFPLAARIPNRVGRLRAYGNAIVPQVAAQFITAFMEVKP